MKIKIFVFLVGTILILQSCATSPTTKISAVVTMDQKVGYGNTIVSQKKHFISCTPYTQLDTAISNTGLAKDKTKFILTVENCGTDPIDFSNEQISIMFTPTGTEIESVPIGIQSWKEFVEKMDSEYDKNEKQYLYTTLNSIYMLSELAEDVPTIIPDVRENLDDLVFDLESMRNQKDVLQEVLPSIIIKPQRILPGRSYSGILICETRDLDKSIPGNFRISVLIDGEAHQFIFKRDVTE